MKKREREGGERKGAERKRESDDNLKKLVLSTM